MSCQRAQEFLGKKKITVKEQVDARKIRVGKQEALKLARSVRTVVASKGAKVMRWDMAKDKPTDQELLAVLLGPSGNLRAPSFRVGQTLVVGFNESAYREVGLA